MSGQAPSRRHDHWHQDPGARLFLIALAIVLLVFLVALTLAAESAGGLL
jgi:hypothetical protein